MNQVASPLGCLIVEKVQDLTTLNYIISKYVIILSAAENQFVICVHILHIVCI